MTDHSAVAGTAAARPARRRLPVALALAVWGPGLVVMLADTDAGSLLTAAQSGARWGYAMVLPQVVLIPILFLVQEITVRLGAVTGKGHGQLIRERFGVRWAVLSSGTLLVSAVGALLTEFAGIAGVGELFGVSKWVTVPVTTVALVAVVFARSYRRVERIGLAVGLAELAIIPAVALAHPDPHQLVAGLGTVPLADRSYLTLLAANVGAVVMPWMLFYQQAAVVDKGLGPADLRSERHDTAIGAVVTQVVMISVVVAVAAGAGGHGGGGHGGGLHSIAQIATALTPRLGATSARVLVGASVLGAAVVAALVVSLAGAWGMAEVAGWDHSLNRRPGRRNGRFLLVYALSHVAGAVLVLASVDLIGLAVDVEVMNALLLPVVLGFLLVLERRALPAEHRMGGAYRVVATGLCLVVMGFGLVMVPSVLGGHW